ncbi:MAG: 50S ribosomal protein L25 [Patescibacteria group bacterium]|jgi:large subunit ribosomal protein L25
MEIKLSAQLRDKNEKLGADLIPAVIYGKGVENKSLKVKKVELEKAFAAAGESNLISLDFGSGAVKVLVKETQRDVLKNTFTHVDFYQVNMKEKITAEIPFHFIGEAKAIKELGGVLIKDMAHLEVECLPGDLADHIDVDISVLKTFDDAIRINDLTLPKGISAVSHTNEMIAAVREPKVEAEPTPVVAEAAPAAGAPVAGALAAGAKKEEGKKPEAKK